MRTLKTVFFLSFLLLPLLFVRPLKALHTSLPEKASMSAAYGFHYDSSASSSFDDLNDMDLTDDDDINESLVHSVLFIVSAFSLFILLRVTLSPERIPGLYAHSLVFLRSQPSFLQVFRI